MKPIAIGYRIVVELDAVEEKTAGGIIITSQRKESDEITCTLGTIDQIGEFSFWNKYDCKEGWPTPWYAVGDRVLIPEHVGRFWKDEETGKTYRIMNWDDVISKV